MQREYTDHWEDRLPRAEKPESYKKLGLPLVLAPFVLMFCGGCVATAPTVSILIAALAGLMWFGDVVVDATKTTRYWVVHRKRPLWSVGETKEDAYKRRTAPVPIVLQDAERYPEDYAGRIQTLIPATEDRPGWASDIFGAIVVDLTTTQIQSCWRRESKVIGDKLLPVTFEDKYGAIASTLLDKYSSTDVLEAKHAIADARLEEINKDVVQMIKNLPQTVTHTGTGLYAVKTSPTNETEAQSGAVAGQVVTIAGTVAASPAFTGGYITNSTQAETRAIVSHNTTTATLEGDISGWGDEDVLEWYDAWSTIDAAGEQLLVDQGATDFDQKQEMRLYAGTYTEAVNIGTMAPTNQFRWVWTVNGSDSVTISNTGQAAALLELTATDNTEFHDMTLNCDNNFLLDAANLGPFWLYDVDCTGTNGGECYSISCTRCTFTNYNYAFRAPMSEYIECTFTGCTSCIGHNNDGEQIRAIGCLFDTCTNVWRGFRTKYAWGSSQFALEFFNCTVYNCTYLIYHTNSFTDANAFQIRVRNTVFHTVTTVYYGQDAEAELVISDCDYNTYYNCTQVAYLGGSNLSFGQWQALTDSQGVSPDANSITTDPGLTAPASEDFSLTAASNCVHAGIGSFAVCQRGINAVAFDKWHPDKGAWSSGPGPNVAHSG